MLHVLITEESPRAEFTRGNPRFVRAFPSTREFKRVQDTLQVLLRRESLASRRVI
jgi:hypothetical protein